MYDSSALKPHDASRTLALRMHDVVGTGCICLHIDDSVYLISHTRLGGKDNTLEQPHHCANPLLAIRQSTVLFQYRSFYVFPNP